MACLCTKRKQIYYAIIIFINFCQGMNAWRSNGFGLCFFSLLKWCTTGDGNPILLKHISCGADLNAEVRCDRCGEGLIVTEVHFKR
jgi:hypothetical protein